MGPGFQAGAGLPWPWPLDPLGAVSSSVPGQSGRQQDCHTEPRVGSSHPHIEGRTSECALLLLTTKDVTCMAPSSEPTLHLPHLGIGLLIGIHKHGGCTDTHFFLVAERLHEQAADCQIAPSGRGALFSLSTYLRAVSFGVTLHILHSCQRVKAPDNPTAEGQELAGSPSTLSRGAPWQR